MFDHVGVVEFDAKVANADAMLEAAIEAGAEDVASSENGHEIYTAQDSLREVAKALEAKFGEPRKAALVWKPQNTIAVDDEQGEKLLKLIETLNENDDVQNVYANFEVSDALVAEDERVAHRPPPSSAIFQDVQAGVVVGRIDQPGRIDEHVGRLDHARAVRPVVHHACRRRRHPGADLAGRTRSRMSNTRTPAF